MADFDTDSVLVCDDVRREITNKDILIGVYAADIIVPQLPILINLAYWLVIIPKRAGNLEIDLKVEPPGAPQSLTINLKAEVGKELSRFSVLVPPIGHPINKEGQLRLLGKPKESQKWKVLLRKDVVFRAIMPPTASISMAAI